MQIVAKLNKASLRRAGRALSGPFLLLVVACLPASAQDNWSYAVAPYLWVASVEADTSLPSLSVQSVRQLGEETGTAVDQRRFRANVYLDFTTASGFGENQFVGRSLRIGSKAVVAILERDPRCAMITLDPETGKSNPELLKKVAQAHEGMAGVYGAVLVEGTLRKGDTVELLDSGVEAP